MLRVAQVEKFHTHLALLYLDRAQQLKTDSHAAVPADLNLVRYRACTHLKL